MATTTLGVRAWLLLLSLLTSLPLFAFAGYATYRLAQAEQDATLTNLVQRNDAAASSVRQHLQSWSTLLMTLARSDAALNGDVHSLYDHAIRMKELYPDIASISLNDRLGNSLFDTLTAFDTDLAPTRQPEMVERILATGQPQLSDVFMGATGNSLKMAIGVPVTVSGGTVYSLQLNVPVRALNAVLDAENLPQGWYAAIVNRQGTVLARNRAPEEVVGRKATAPFLKVLEHARRGVLDLPSVDGTNLTRAFVKVAPWDVTVMVGVPEDVYWAPLKQSLVLIVSGGLAFVAIGLTLAAWFSGRLARDVADASVAATALGRGEAPSPRRTRIREVNALGRALLDAHELLRRHDEARAAEHRAALEAKAEAEQANLSKSKFLASASHDLRQPLQSMMLFASVLQPHVQGEQGAKALAHLGRGLDALKELLDSLLDISRLDAGVVDPTLEDFDVGSILGPIITAYDGVARSKGLALEATACSASVRSDRTLLARMIRNLLENAVRYTRAGAIRVTCHADGGRLRIAVSDTGIGIPADHLARIWEEFHQVANQERDRSQGLGLGLAIVRRLSALLDHPVDVRSTPDQGSVFTISIPLGAAVADPAPEPASFAPPPGVRNRFAVIIDDDAMVLLGLTTLLEDWGYRVLTATSAERALAGLAGAGRRPDIILCDFSLPHCTGTETILKIRRRYGADLPGILLTGETDGEVAREASRHGLHLIHKPVTPRQLAATIQELAGSGPGPGSESASGPVVGR
ncbi:hybrid sensor histidine kinase/response regulator [Azospirillum picis]|uniref:histidine kinase n=1 Tax=Azospirillum picis TaxID=488438 RepID=A0ABU0MJ50_9PROT|nr:ATP-binding protein [Azospirillum picis]MBP2299703.1 signal transduction histidine kinase/CheY-like chemotaxis protein [Azospirillum picis]MDQ0533499.1 signal transduction histidine kinase/CheY-like chemotaxis protein [Azospirillum picis]